MGSWFFLAALLVDRPLESDTPHTTDHCGTCTACLDACPTDAFPAPWVLDARRCISYLTIELRGDPIPGELREGLGSWLFGCDVCQDVCPWNRDTPATGSAEFEPREDLLPADVVPLLQLDEESYNQRFAGTPLDRPGRDGLVQNAAIVAGNSRQPAAVPSLVRLLEDDNPILRSSAAWALGRIAGKDGLVALRDRRAVEDNPSVQEEIDAALLVSPERSERE
jgi:epoxyqueuosine reductase